MIALVNMPYANLMLTPLAIGLLKARLSQAGLACSAFNFNFLFAELIGMDQYQAITSQGARVLGEWFFAPAAWQEAPRFSDSAFLQQTEWPAEMSPDRFKEIRKRIVPAFIETAAARIVETRSIRSVGFSCSFLQTIASLALIRRIKQLNPEIKIVCGGHDFHGSMGRQRISACTAIDAACMGEADDTIVPLFEALSQGREPIGLQGVIYRDDKGRLHEGPAARPVASRLLEENPFPDFDEYFHDLSRFGLTEDPLHREKLFSVIETSRGCWKGQRRQCAFCGIGQESLRFRQTGARRVIQCLEYLTARYPLRQFIIADNILPKNVFDEWLPEMKAKPIADGIKLLVQSSPTLNRRQVELLSGAGVTWVIAGIESLSTHMLQCMRKDATSLGNIYFLKLCRIFGVYPLWNLLVRIPGETEKDYRHMIEMIPGIIHFTPPFGGIRPVEMQRFSPYFNHPGRWADHIRPRPYYRALYPEDVIDLGEAAYFFDADWKDVLVDSPSYEKLRQHTDTWNDRWTRGEHLPGLTVQNLTDGGLELVDTRRSDRMVTISLDPAEAEVFRGIEDPTPIEALMRLPGLGDLEEKTVCSILEAFISEGVAISENGHFLGLAIPGNAPQPDTVFMQDHRHNGNSRPQ